jgi:hypothetical protein
LCASLSDVIADDLYGTSMDLQVAEIFQQAWFETAARKDWDCSFARLQSPCTPL